MKKPALLLAFLMFVSGATYAAETASHRVRLQTNMGDIILQLNAEKAPITVANFESYVSSGFYDGVIFHRVIDNFMIQSGGFLPGLIKKVPKNPQVPIKNEADNGLSNTVGTIAMARKGDPHSATSQFFINVNDNSPLDYSAPTPKGWGYTVFGKVVEGMDVVNKIKQVPTRTVRWFKNLPIEDVIIEKAELLP